MDARIVPPKPHNEIKQGYELCESGGGLFIVYDGPEGHDENPMFDKFARSKFEQGAAFSTLAPTVCLSARFNCVSSSHARTGER